MKTVLAKGRLLLLSHLLICWSYTSDAFSPQKLVTPNNSKSNVEHDSPRSTLVLRSSTTTSTSDETIERERISLLQEILRNARTNGPIGIESSESSRTRIQQTAQKLKPYSLPNPTSLPLEGTHSLLYSLAHSVAKDGTKKASSSSGKIGPFSGIVTQEFIDDVKFINRVRLFGGFVDVALRADRKALDEERIRVSFREMSFTVAGVEVMKKDIGGGGIWKVLFVGEVEEGGKNLLVRVMKTPNLFVLTQEL